MRLQLFLGLLLLSLAACGTEGGTAEPLRVTLRSLPAAYVGERYDVRVPASGGIRPYRYELEGDLPDGLTFAAGRFSGTPRKKGSFRVTLAVSDAALSVRTVSYNLKVTDPPPPRLEVKQPRSETESPFIAVFKLSDRPTSALRLHLDLKNLTPDLKSFSAHAGLLYVLRYDAEKHTLDLDGAFTGVVKGIEVFRLKLAPAKKLRPNLRPSVQFFNAKGEPYTPKPPKRPADEGRFSFADLRALAASWPQPEKKPAPKTAPGGEAKKASEPAAPEPQSAAGERQPAKGQAEKPAGEPAAQKEPQKTVPGDLNGDGRVGPADLELLRSSYAFNPGGSLNQPEKKEPAKPGSEGANKAGDGSKKSGDEAKPNDQTPPADTP